MERDKFSIKLSAYKDGELDGNLNDEVFLHVRNCEACKKQLAELEQVDLLVKEMPRIEARESFALRVIARISTNEQGHFDTAPFSNRVRAKFLQLADSIFELISGREREGATLDEFSDFPPLSMSHAFFQVIGPHR